MILFSLLQSPCFLLWSPSGKVMVFRQAETILWQRKGTKGTSDTPPHMSISWNSSTTNLRGSYYVKQFWMSLLSSHCFLFCAVFSQNIERWHSDQPSKIMMQSSSWLEWPHRLNVICGTGAGILIRIPATLLWSTVPLMHPGGCIPPRWLCNPCRTPERSSWFLAWGRHVRCCHLGVQEEEEGVLSPHHLLLLSLTLPFE